MERAFRMIIIFKGLLNIKMEDLTMCEFKVLLEEKKIFQDVIYAKVEGNDVILKDVMGVIRRVPSSRIVEVDVASAKLVIEKR